MARKTKAKQPSAPQETYAEWEVRVRAEIQRREIPAAYVRERDLRILFIAGLTPEQATDRIEVAARNARTSFERQKRR